jgi:hypothetical protein
MKRCGTDFIRNGGKEGGGREGISDQFREMFGRRSAFFEEKLVEKALFQCRSVAEERVLVVELDGMTQQV